MSQAIFKNPYVSIAPVLTGTGNGTLTVDRLTHFTINQKYTVICTAVAPFTVFSIVGDKDGPVGVAVVGTQFYDEDLKVFFTIQQGPTLFVIGDKFEFTVAQGTDLNNENIDDYDELPQKNFSAGVNGTNSGDDNLRFRTAINTAKLRLGDLLFTSDLAEELGNFIQIEYVAALPNVYSSLVVQDLTYSADAVGPGGDAITIEYEDWTPPSYAVAALGGANGVGFTADTIGSAGNGITVEYTDGAPTSTPVVSVLLNAITVQIQNGITTANQIVSAISGFPAAAALIDAVAVGVGTTPQVAPAGPVTLSGGANAIGAAGAEVVSVTVNAIKVKLQSGVSTATQVKAAVDAFPAAAALVNVAITGAGGNPQTAPTGPTNLAGGQIGTYPPGSELVEVFGTKIKVTFQSGQSTATQIKTAIEAVAEAAALVTITVPGTGSNTQTAPQKKFLSGGSWTDNWTLNINELTAPLTFFEGSGNLLINKLFAQDIANFRKKVTMGGLLELNDGDADDNLSGDAIPNVQRAINQILSQLQITAITGTKRVRISGVDVTLLDGRLLSQEMSKKIMAFEGAQIDFATGNVYEADGVTSFPDNFTPAVVPNGSYQWYSIGFAADVATADNRMGVKIMVGTAAGNGITPEAAPKANFLGARPIGEVVVLGSGGTIANLTNANIRQMFPGGGGGSAIGFQETPVGLVNGLNAIFTLSKLPTDDNSIIMVVNGLVVPRSAYTVVGSTITFLAGWIPETCQDVYAWYLTEGSPSSPPVATGQEQVEYRTITSGEALAKQLVLTGTPAFPAKVKLDVAGGTTQVFGDDFSVVGNVVEWTGLGLDAIPTEAGDKWRITYFT